MPLPLSRHDSGNAAGAADDPWVISGFITKRGESRKNWKRRFMVLHASGLLRYYKTGFEEGRKTPKPCGQINVSTECAAIVEITNCDCEWPLPATANNAFGLATDSRVFFLVCESDAECAQWIRHLKSRLPSDAAAALGGGAEPFDPSSRWREGRDPSFKGRGSPARTVYEEVEPQGLRKSIGDNKGIQYQHVQPPNPGGKSPQVAQPECVYSVPVRHKDTHGADGSTKRESDLVYSVVTPAQLRAGAAAPPLPPRAADGTDSVLYSSLAFSDEDDSDDDDTIQAVLGGSLVASGIVPRDSMQVYQNVVLKDNATVVPLPPPREARAHKTRPSEAPPQPERRRYQNVPLQPQ
eukprot:m.8063 g.8063  ORF g.8063 m.8063 type:complete len:352 (+) comp4020_c0_seq1:221-1276(+)